MQSICPEKLPKHHIKLQRRNLILKPALRKRQAFEFAESKLHYLPSFGHPAGNVLQCPENSKQSSLFYHSPPCCAEGFACINLPLFYNFLDSALCVRYDFASMHHEPVNRMSCEIPYGIELELLCNVLNCFAYFRYLCSWPEHWQGNLVHFLRTKNQIILASDPNCNSRVNNITVYVNAKIDLDIVLFPYLNILLLQRSIVRGHLVYPD